MAITTGLSVPVFNVLKYLFIIVFIETIARGALNNIHVFLRRFDLYKGRGTALSRSRIDRYNLLQVRAKQSFLRIIFWMLLVTCFYAVEIMFEFSSTAVPQVTGRPARKLVYNASYSACVPADVMEGFVASTMAEMAMSCVDLTDTEYTLYRPLWIKDESQAGETALCVKVPQNVLRKGNRIYKDRRFTKGSPSWDAVADLIASVKASAWITNFNNDKALVVITVSSADILFLNTLSPLKHTYRIGHMAVSVPSRPNAFCGGYVAGAVGEGVMKVRMYACVENSTSGFHYLQVHGTAAIFLDADLIQKEYWTVDVVTYFGVAIRNFAEGVIDPNDEQRPQKLLAFSGMLGAAIGKDSDSLNRYAVIIKHCNLFNIAQEWDKSEWREVQQAIVRETITVSLSEWGLIMVIGWSFTLYIAAKCLQYVADRRGMPRAVEGEMDIARRWANQEDVKVNQVITKPQQGVSFRTGLCRFLHLRRKQIHLIVEAGQEYDDVVANHISVEIQRDTSKPFKAI